jgi:hypothetical protein
MPKLLDAGAGIEEAAGEKRNAKCLRRQTAKFRRVIYFTEGSTRVRRIIKGPCVILRWSKGLADRCERDATM